MHEWINPERLKKHVEQNVDIVQQTFNDYHIGSPIVAPVARLLFQLCWDAIEPILTDMPKVYNELSLNPKNKEILDTNEGRQYMENTMKKAYDFIYFFTWEA